MLNQILDRLTKKKWSDAEINAMVGVSRAAYLAHASDESIRDLAASGGATSALLIAAVESGQIDGAIVCRTFIEDGKVRAHFVLARTRQEILAARGSKYVQTNFLREVLPIFEENAGRFAICGLPCDITNIHRMEQKNPELAKKIALKISFLCGHNSRKELIDAISCQLCKQAGGGDLIDFSFRTGHWRGRLEAKFDNGKVIRRSFTYFSDYRNLYFFAERKCVACIDHFGYEADISLGDVWLYSLRDSSIKHTGVLVRTERAASIFDAAVTAGIVVAKEVNRELILDGQTRIAPTHYNVSARSRAGKWLGLKIPDKHGMSVGPTRWFSAFIGLANMRWSESERADTIFKIPRPMLRGYLIFKKGVESIT